MLKFFRLSVTGARGGEKQMQKKKKKIPGVKADRLTQMRWPRAQNIYFVISDLQKFGKLDVT